MKFLVMYVSLFGASLYWYSEPQNFKLIQHFTKMPNPTIGLVFDITINHPTLSTLDLPNSHLNLVNFGFVTICPILSLWSWKPKSRLWCGYYGYKILNFQHEHICQEQIQSMLQVEALLRLSSRLLKLVVENSHSDDKFVISD